MQCVSYLHQMSRRGNDRDDDETKRIEACYGRIQPDLVFAMVWPTLAQEKPLAAGGDFRRRLAAGLRHGRDAHGAKVPHLRKFLHEALMRRASLA